MGNVLAAAAPMELYSVLGFGLVSSATGGLRIFLLVCVLLVEDIMHFENSQYDHFNVWILQHIWTLKIQLTGCSTNERVLTWQFINID